MNQYVTGAVIKKLREEKNMTQQQLADKLSVSAKKISKWETAKGYPDITLLESIANALSVSVTELIYGNTIVNSNVSANNAAFTFLCVYGVWKYRSQHGRNSNSVSYSMFIRVNGKPQLCMLVSIAGCILNVVLDYMFVARMELGVKEEMKKKTRNIMFGLATVFVLAVPVAESLSLVSAILILPFSRKKSISKASLPLPDVM